MATVTVYGASDDLIEVEGDVEREFAYQEKGDRIVFPTGTVIGVYYNDDGMWQLEVIEKGNAEVTHREGTDVDDDYSDVVTVTGDFVLVAHAYDE